MSKLVATKGHAIITLKPADETFGNGLIVPETFRKGSTEGIVVNSAIDEVVEGDTVLLDNAFVGSAVSHDGVEYIIVVPEEILAVVEA